MQYSLKIAHNKPNIVLFSKYKLFFLKNNLSKNETLCIGENVFFFYEMI
jgi:hypothetical protein